MEIKAKKRTVLGKKNKRLRRQGILPASVYGPKHEPTSIEIDPREFHKVYAEAGTNKFVDLIIDGDKKVRVLIKEVQANPLTDDYIHVSFYAIDENKSIIAEVPIKIIGESSAVKNNIGFLVVPFDSLVLRCLPKDLPENIEVDISKLDKIGDNVLISDIKFPDGVEIAGEVDKTASLAYIAPPQKEIVEEEVSEKTEETEEEGQEEDITSEEESSKTEEKQEEGGE